MKRKHFSFIEEKIPPFVTKKKKKGGGGNDPNSAAFPPFSTPVNEEGPPTPRKGGRKSKNAPKAEGKKTPNQCLRSSFQGTAEGLLLFGCQGGWKEAFPTENGGKRPEFHTICFLTENEVKKPYFPLIHYNS